MHPRYCHVGTGNYNSRTAACTGPGLLTSDDEIGADVGDLFNYLTGSAASRITAGSGVTGHLARSVLELIAEQPMRAGGRIVLKING